jgi:hypothetical protein
MQIRRLTARTSLAFAFTLVLPLFCSVHVKAQDPPPCSQSYIDSLPQPAPTPPAVRVVQLVNCSREVILGASNAAAVAGHVPYPVFPRENTWVMQPYGSLNNANVLTIDIPPEWVGTVPKKSSGPNIWARTGCRYDVTANRAQCETGSCAGQYDCSSGGFGPPGVTTLTEWTFYQPVQNGDKTYFFDHPDISAVNGANLTVDIEPVGGDPTDPTAPTNDLWLKWNYPLSVPGADLRANDNGDFNLKRSDIDKSGVYGYVIVDEDGNPVMPPGDNVLACFNNCGKYEYPNTPAMDCDPTDPNQPDCYAWKTFCAGDPSLYGQECTDDDDCIVKGVNVHASCWKNTDPQQKKGRCSLRAFYQKPSNECPDEPAGPASKVPCTFAYGATNPLTNMRDYSTQPPSALCESVIGPDGKEVACIGDDTVHQVFHGAYTWPNDPETFADDATLYRIIYAPGGTQAPITPAQDSIPLCSRLPSNYNYSQNYAPGGASPCSVPVDHEGAVFAVANPNGKPWACNLDQRGAGNEGVICRWHPAPARNCSPALTDQYVTQSACGLIDSGTSLVSSSIKPKSNDWLFAEVTIPDVLNSVQLPEVSGCASSWSLVKSQFINTDQGLAAWYEGMAKSSSECQVTVTLQAENPAALKVYDVPSANGIVEATSANSGNFIFTAPGQSFPTVSAGSATTSHPDDLMLGNLLQVNQQPTPITYWVNWLTNSLGTPPNNIDCELDGEVSDLYCPTDDGTDYLPGHGANSSNADTGHQHVGPGQHALLRDGQNLGSFGWGGVAIYIELNKSRKHAQTRGDTTPAAGSQQGTSAAVFLPQP